MRSKLLALFGLALIVASSCTPNRCANIRDVQWTIQFAGVTDELLKYKGSAEGTFEIIVESENSPFPPSHNSLKQYPWLLIKPRFNGVKAGEYIFYCPHVGCPAHPEFLSIITIDDEGKVFFGEMKIPLSIHTHALAIPGFSSDWFLIPLNKELTHLHTTFTYQPITASSANGRKVQLNKKEPGGNVLEIQLFGYEPHETVKVISNSEKEILVFNITADETGSHKSYIRPQVIGKTKGIDTITVISKTETLQVECPWDMSTLDIKREQSRSDFQRTRF